MGWMMEVDAGMVYGWQPRPYLLLCAPGGARF